jgi:hypothetical protein
MALLPRRWVRGVVFFFLQGVGVSAHGSPTMAPVLTAPLAPLSLQAVDMMTAYRNVYAVRVQAPEVHGALQALQAEGEVVDMGELLSVEEEGEYEEGQPHFSDLAAVAAGEEGTSRGPDTDWEPSPFLVQATPMGGWPDAAGPSVTPVGSTCQALSETPAVDQQTWETTTSVAGQQHSELEVLEGSISPEFNLPGRA